MKVLDGNTFRFAFQNQVLKNASLPSEKHATPKNCLEIQKQVTLIVKDRAEKTLNANSFFTFLGNFV